MNFSFVVAKNYESKHGICKQPPVAIFATNGCQRIEIPKFIFCHLQRKWTLNIRLLINGLSIRLCLFQWCIQPFRIVCILVLLAVLGRLLAETVIYVFAHNN